MPVRPLMILRARWTTDEVMSAKSQLTRATVSFPWEITVALAHKGSW